MSATYGSPNFSSPLKIIILMRTNREMTHKYPLGEKNQQIVSHKDILDKMIEPGEGASFDDYAEVLLEMATDNPKVS